MEEKKLTKYGNRTANVTIVKNFGAYAMIKFRLGYR